MDINERQASKVLASLGDKAKKTVKNMSAYCKEFNLHKYFSDWINHRKHKNKSGRENISINIDPKILWCIAAIDSLGEDNKVCRSRTSALENAFWYALQNNFFNLDNELQAQLLMITDHTGVDKLLDELLSKSSNKKMLLQTLVSRLETANTTV